MAKYRQGLRGHLDPWRQVTFVLFDLGAMNLIAGIGVTFFYSNPLALLGFTSRSLWLGLFFVLSGLLTWKLRRLPAIIPVVIIIGDLWNTITILPTFERAGYVVLVQTSFVLPLVFILISILRARLKRAFAGSAPQPNSFITVEIRSAKDALALLSSMFLSVGMGLAVLLLFSKYGVNQIAEATNPFINIFHDFLLVPALLLCFPLGAALGELIWLQASRFYLRDYELADFIRYLKQIPLVSRFVVRMLQNDPKPASASIAFGEHQVTSFQPQVLSHNPTATSQKKWRLLWLTPLVLIVLAVTAAIFLALPERLEFSRRVKAIEETPAAPGMLVVSQSGQAQFQTIAAALAAATPGQTILVRAGVYYENLVIDKPVTLAGDSKANGRVILQCSNGVCLTVSANATVRNLTVNAHVGFWSRLIRRVEADAVVIFHGRPLLESCDVSSNTGMGIVVTGSGSQAEIKNVKVHDCLLNGLLFTEQSQGVVSDSDVYQTGWAGIRSDNKSNLTIRRTRIHHGRMDGVVVRDRGAATFEDCQFFENAKSGIHVRDASSIAVIRGKVFNQKNGGVFIHDRGSTGRLEECEIFGNAYSGIEIADQADAVVIKSKVYRGQSVGITVWRQSTATVEESLIFENASMGMLMATASKAVVRKSVFRANTPVGIQVESGSDPLIEQCQIYGGRGSGLLFRNGAKGRVEDCAVFGHMNANVVIMTGSSPQIHKSRLSESGQAGLLVQEGGLGVIENCKIANNYVGVEIKDSGAPTIQHCQINGNRSQGVTADSASSGSITASNVTGNSAGSWKIESGSRITRDRNVE